MYHLISQETLRNTILINNVKGPPYIYLDAFQVLKTREAVQIYMEDPMYLHCSNTKQLRRPVFRLIPI